MKKLLTLLLAATLLAACGEDDGRTYVSDHNYYTMEMSEGQPKGYDWAYTAQEKLFPKYFVYRAKEWPREDLSNASSYDLPRVQFFWANLGDKDNPMYTEYEGQAKIWSMKTDGTDLRLVTDDGEIGLTGKGKMARSPDNRYLAYSLSNRGNAVYDLKTGETYVLNDYRGPVGYLWAEDSSYLYFRTSVKDVYKWDVKTHKKEKVDIYISDTGVIYEGIRYIVSDGGASAWKEDSNEWLYLRSWSKRVDKKYAYSDYRSVSPKGNFAWGGNRKNTFFVEMKNDQVEVNSTSMSYIVGLDGRFFSSNRHAMVMAIRDRATMNAWTWRPLGHNRTLEPLSLYNAFANNGIWFKEMK